MARWLSLFLVLVCVGQLIPDNLCLCMFVPIENSKRLEKFSESCCDFKEIGHDSCRHEDENISMDWNDGGPLSHQCPFMKPESNDSWVPRLYDEKNLDVPWLFSAWSIAVKKSPIHVFKGCSFQPIILPTVPIYLSFQTLLI